ncbi:MAG: prepilin-type N-terminal cleavage/methylation domain-containing protein [Candidatus Omnitrophica bacterium]|nr:prepilin-type N-terminal cleavage/methylation domain-containing protein [Candidatus Omnitrophota bacterium]
MKLNRKGLSLIEVMIGVFVLLVSILAALSGFLGSMFLNNSSNNLTTAVNDAQYVLEQVKGLDYATCIQNLPNACYTIPTFINLSGETVAFDPAPTTIGPNIRKIAVKVSWQDKGQTRSFSLASYFAK